jgi:hypothetical protein
MYEIMVHSNCTKTSSLSSIRDICDFKAASPIDTAEKNVVSECRYVEVFVKPLRLWCHFLNSLRTFGTHCTE